MHKIRWEYKISASFNLPCLDDVYSGSHCILISLCSEPIVSGIEGKKCIRKEIKLIMSKKLGTANTFLRTCYHRKYM